jgi:hypothetical protein
MSTLDEKEAFRHVADTYRWLACAARTLDDLQRGGFSKKELDIVKRLIPGPSAAFQASALVHARGLIEFYRPAGLPTDVDATKDFRIDLSGNKDLEYLADTVKPSIDKHLAHITEYRHAAHPERSTYERLEWTSETPKIVDALVKLLRTVAKLQIPFQPKFEQLLDAVEHQLHDRTYKWPERQLNQ